MVIQGGPKKWYLSYIYYIVREVWLFWPTRYVITGNKTCTSLLHLFQWHALHRRHRRLWEHVAIWHLGAGAWPLGPGAAEPRGPGVSWPPIFQVRGPHVDLDPHFLWGSLGVWCCWQHVYGKLSDQANDV